MHRAFLSSALVAFALFAGLLAQSPGAEATTPNTANWYSWRLDTSAPSVKNSTSAYIGDALLSLNIGTRMSPYEVTSSPDIYLDNYFEASGYWGWLEQVRHGITICGGRSYGDTGNCNYTTSQGEWGQIYVNTYHSLTSYEDTWLVMHELGHAFGLRHHSGTFMNDTYTGLWDLAHIDFHLGARY